MLKLREHELLGVHRGGLAEQQAFRQVLLVERLEHVLAYSQPAHMSSTCTSAHEKHEQTARTVQEPEQDHDAVEKAIELLFGHLLVARAQLGVHVLRCTQQEYTEYEYCTSCACQVNYSRYVVEYTSAL